MSMRAISRAIGASPNAVSEIWTANKEPGVDKVLAIIDAIGASRTAILAGYPMTPETEQLVALLSRMSPAARVSALQFLRDLQAQTNEPGTQPSPPLRAADTSK
jgi:transcriptional regulator with XRE-family HTH domain